MKGIQEIYLEIKEMKSKGYIIGSNSKLLKLYKASLKPLEGKEKEALIGLSLGDMNIKKLNTGTRVRWEYGYRSEGYVRHIHNLYKYLIISDPYVKERNGVKTFRFQTLTLKELDFLSELFINSEAKKCVREHLITDHVTAISLAYWFMDDGGKLDYSSNEGKGIVYNTQGFKTEEVEGMCKELRDKFKFDTWVGNNKGPVIKISGRSYERFMDIVGPFIHESMRYKLPSNRNLSIKG